MGKDIYDEEIERLTANPQDIRDSWYDCRPLFKTCKGEKGNSKTGCLTEIRNPNMGCIVTIHPHIDEQLTTQIMNDERIPRFVEDITVADLPVFAEWQRTLDTHRAQYTTK
jgi:hypothetical protein